MDLVGEFHCQSFVAFYCGVDVVGEEGADVFPIYDGAVGHVDEFDTVVVTDRSLHLENILQSEAVGGFTGIV